MPIRKNSKDRDAVELTVATSSWSHSQRAIEHFTKCEFALQSFPLLLVKLTNYAETLIIPVACELRRK